MRAPTSVLILTAAACLLTSCASTSAPAPAPTATGPAIAPTTTAPAPASPTANGTGWLAGGGQDALHTLAQEIRTVSSDARTNLTGDNLINDCTLLDSEQGVAAALPPIPVPTAQQHWSAALASIKQGTFHCIHGATSSDAAEAQGGNASISSALPDLQAVSKQLHAH